MSSKDVKIEKELKKAVRKWLKGKICFNAHLSERKNNRKYVISIQLENTVNIWYAYVAFPFRRKERADKLINLINTLIELRG